jgi:four helix bundle protein
MNKFRDLLVWQKAMELAEQVYVLTKGFPVDERYGLQSQVRRCSVSIPSNIAEGAGRNSDKEFRYFLSIALASGFELETQLLLASKFNYIIKEKLEAVISKLQEVQKMLNGLQKSLAN